jgi:hypothetical protein
MLNAKHFIIKTMFQNASFDFVAIANELIKQLSIDRSSIVFLILYKNVEGFLEIYLNFLKRKKITKEDFF